MFMDNCLTHTDKKSSLRPVNYSIVNNNFFAELFELTLLRNLGFGKRIRETDLQTRVNFVHYTLKD